MLRPALVCPTCTDAVTVQVHQVNLPVTRKPDSMPVSHCSHGDSEGGSPTPYTRRIRSVPSQPRPPAPTIRRDSPPPARARWRSCPARSPAGPSTQSLAPARAPRLSSPARILPRPLLRPERHRETGPAGWGGDRTGRSGPVGAATGPAGPAARLRVPCICARGSGRCGRFRAALVPALLLLLRRRRRWAEPARPRPRPPPPRWRRRARRRRLRCGRTRAAGAG